MLATSLRVGGITVNRSDTVLPLLSLSSQEDRAGDQRRQVLCDWGRYREEDRRLTEQAVGALGFGTEKIPKLRLATGKEACPSGSRESKFRQTGRQGQR